MVPPRSAGYDRSATATAFACLPFGAGVAAPATVGGIAGGLHADLAACRLAIAAVERAHAAHADVSALANGPTAAAVERVGERRDTGVRAA